VAVVLLGGLLSGCDSRQQVDQIEWQLPLEAPSDPHGTQMDAHALPEWASQRQGTAEIVWLQKSTTRVFTVKMAMGEQAEVEGWKIRLLGLAEGLRIQSGAFLDDPNVHNAAAFVEISRDGNVAYRGWLYEEFPELFGLDDPEWKVWLKTISVQPASQEANSMHP